MTRPADALVAAVRGEIADLRPDEGVLVACSGGADSMALAAAAARLSRGANPPQFTGAVVVDHGLQRGSAAVAAETGRRCVELGLEPVEVLAVAVGSAGGPEAAARTARYEALTDAARRLRAAAVLLGHTEDDQAETVLVGLTRGSGPRVLAGMPRRTGLFRRPFLHLSRSTVRSAFGDLQVWDDPHNDDPRFVRSVVRHEVLPSLVAALGPEVVPALARSAALTRAESEALDVWATRLYDAAVRQESAEVHVTVAAFQGEPEAVVARVLLSAANAAGSPRHRLTAVHVAAMTDLVYRWHGQGPTDLPGGVVAVRRSGTVVLRRVALDR